MTVSQFQSIADYVPCMRRGCEVIDSAVSSTTHSGQGIYFQSLTRYESPTPMHFRALVFSEIHNLSAKGWHVIVQDLAMLDASPYLQKRPCRDVHRVLQTSRVSGANHAVIGVKDSQALPNGRSHPVVSHPLVLYCHGQSCRTKLSMTKLKSVVYTRPPCVVPCVTFKAGP